MVSRCFRFWSCCLSFPFPFRLDIECAYLLSAALQRPVRIMGRRKRHSLLRSSASAVLAGPEFRPARLTCDGMIKPSLPLSLIPWLCTFSERLLWHTLVLLVTLDVALPLSSSDDPPSAEAVQLDPPPTHCPASPLHRQPFSTTSSRLKIVLGSLNTPLRSGTRARS